MLANSIADNTQTYGGSFKVCFCSSRGFHAVETMLLIKPFRQYKQLDKLCRMLFTVAQASWGAHIYGWQYHFRFCLAALEKNWTAVRQNSDRVQGYNHNKHTLLGIGTMYGWMTSQWHHNRSQQSQEIVRCIHTMHMVVHPHVLVGVWSTRLCLSGGVAYISES